MSVRRSIAWAFSGQFIAFFIQFLGSIVIARLLSPHEMGIYAIAMAALGIVQVATTFGIASYVVREAELKPKALDSAFTVNAILVVSLTLLLTVLSFATGPLLGVSEAGSVLRVIALGNLLAIVSFRPAAMLQREMQFKQLSAVTVINGLVQTVATIAFALMGASYLGPAYAAALASIASTAATVMFGRRYNSFRLSLDGWRPITTFGFQMMSVTGVAVLNGRLSELLVGRMLGVAALGFYSRATGLSALIFSNLYGTATRVVFAQLSQQYRNNGDWRATYLRSFAMITAFMWPVLIGLAILSRPVVLLLYGERWLPAALPLSAMMLGQFIGVAFGMNWELFVLRNETGKQARYEIIRFILGMPIFVLGCLFSVLAATVAKIADALIGLVLYYPHVRRLAQLGPYDVPRIYRQSAALTIVAVLPAFAVMTSYDWSSRTPLPAICGAVAVGIILWLTTILTIGHPLKDEFLLLRRKLQRS